VALSVDIFEINKLVGVAGINTELLFVFLYASLNDIVPDGLPNNVLTVAKSKLIKSLKFNSLLTSPKEMLPAACNAMLHLIW